MPYSYQVFYGQTINNLTATKVLGNLNGGSFTTGTSAAWLTGPATGSTVSFTSSTASTNVTNLTATSSAPSIAPTITVSEGGAVATETASVVFKALAAGQVLQMAGLTFTSGSSGTTAAQLATAFQSIAVGTLATAINTTKSLGNAAGGSFTAGTATGWSSGATTAGAVTFTSSTTNTNVSNLTSTLSEGSSSLDILTTDGVGATSTETAAVTFKALAAGQSLTMAGLNFTVGSSGATANQIASAFANINNATSAAAINTAKTLNDAAGGVFASGTSAGWSSGNATGAAVTFTSSTANTNVTNLSGALSIADSAPTITVTEGSAVAATESAAVTFRSMTAGQTLTIAGLTYTAGTLGATAEQVASAFSNLAVGTTADNANNILPALASAYVVTPGLLTSTTSLSGYIVKPADGNSYTFLASGTFTGTSNATTTSTIASIKGTVTSFKVFINGALAESINYDSGIDTTMFGITDSTGTPPSPSVAAQRAQATLQFNLISNQINKGSTFTGSDASNGGIDQVLGGTGNDRFIGYASNDYFDGRGGVDTAVYRGSVKNYTLSLSTTIDRTDPLQTNTLSATFITDAVTGRDGVDTLINVERLAFSDATIAYDTAKGMNAGDAYRLYKAAFDRTPDEVGLGYWIKTLDSGTNTLLKVSQGFINSPEFIKLNGVDSSNATFITNLYKFVLKRTPDAAGYQYWDTLLGNNNASARAYVLVDFANSPENIAQVANLIANGISYTEYIG